MMLLKESFPLRTGRGIYYSIILGLLLCNIPRPLLAQNSIKMGDLVPELTLHNVVNYKNTTLKLSDFQGKIVLLDFWATWCGSCIKAMPKLDSLQKEFADHLQIISVTYQKKAEIDKFKKLNSTVQNFKLPMVTGDEQLIKLFPHRALPHLVWISQEGKFISTSSGYTIADSTFQNLLKVADK